MSTVIKNSPTKINGTIKRNDLAMGINNVEYGPTDTTGFYDGLSPSAGGYIIYKTEVNGDLDIYKPQDDTELIFIVNSFGADVSTASDAIAWVGAQSNFTILNRNFDNTPTDGLTFYVDAKMLSSYPKTGNTIYDIGNSEFNGTLTNTPTFNNTGIMSFDGVNEFINFGSSAKDLLQGKTALTIGILFKVNTTDVLRGLFGTLRYNCAKNLGLVASYNTLSFYNDTDTCMSAGLSNYVETGKWILAVGTYDGTTTRIYGVKDGVLSSASTTIKSGATNVFDYPLELFKGGLYYTNGSFIKAFVYDRVLSESEILTHYFNEPIVTDGLVLSFDSSNGISNELGSTTIRSTISGYTANLINGVGNTSGYFVFDGVNDYIDLSSTVSVSNWTYSFWVNRTIAVNKLNGSFALSDASGNSIMSFYYDDFYGINSITEDSLGNIYLGTFGILKYQDTQQFCLTKTDSSGNVASAFNRNYNVGPAAGIGNVLFDSSDNLYTAGTNLAQLEKVNSTTGAVILSASNFNSNLNSVQHIDEVNGKIYIIGQFTTVSGSSRIRLAKVNLSDFSLDATLDTSNGFNAQPNNIAVANDGKIYVAGNFTTYKGQTRNYVVRLNADGSIDNTFDVGTGFNNATVSVKLDANQKPVFYGRFTSYNGVSRNRVVRLNTDGTIDSTFNVGTGFNGNVNSMDINLNTNKYYFAGAFSVYNGTNCSYIASVNDDGTYNSTFNIGSGFSWITSVVKVLSSGKVMVGMSVPLNPSRTFTATYNGVQFSSFCRINTDGSFDTTYNTGLGFTEGTYRNSFYLRYLNSSGIPQNYYNASIYPGGSNRLAIDFFKNYWDNKWRNVTISKDSNNAIRFYFDGILRSTFTNFNASDILTLNLKRVSGVDNLSNFQLYNRVLTADEIAQNFKVQSTRFPM